MAANDRIHIIGIGDDGLQGLTAAARELIEQARVLLGPAELLRLVTGGGGERIDVGSDMDGAVKRLEQTGRQPTVLLVSGDPLFYGMARYLCDRLGKDRFEIVPHVSSMQLAFARVKESWEEAYLTNLATRPLEQTLERIRTADKVGLFTTDQSPPKAVAAALLDARIDYFSAYVCENLGSPDERVTQGELAELAGQEFASPNVMILVRKPQQPDRPSEQAGRRMFGNPDEVFLQSRPKHGLLTPSELRCVALAELDLGPTSIVWDIGAGSGSVAIEAAQLAREGTTYAIEMDAEDYHLIVSNAERFQVKNLKAIHGRAPDAWADLPQPDAIFVGGSGRGISRVVDAAYDRLRPGGRLVASVGSIENLSEVHDTLQKRGTDVRVWLFNIARGTYQLERVRFEALNPSFLLAVRKPS